MNKSRKTYSSVMTSLYAAKGCICECEIEAAELEAKLNEDIKNAPGATGAGEVLEGEDVMTEVEWNEILSNSTPEGWRRYFLEQAGGDPVKAAGLEAKLNEDIENDPGELTV